MIPNEIIERMKAKGIKEENIYINECGGIECEIELSDSDVTVKMVFVEGDGNEIPDMLVSKFDCTQELYQEVVGQNPSYNKSSLMNPVEQVNFYDACNMLNGLSEKTGLKPMNNVSEANNSFSMNTDIPIPQQGFRLLESSWWEHICKKNTSSQFPGSNEINEIAWYEGNSDNHTHEVGTLKPKTGTINGKNGEGLYDLIGNVWSWSCTTK